MAQQNSPLNKSPTEKCPAAPEIEGMSHPFFLFTEKAETIITLQKVCCNTCLNFKASPPHPPPPESNQFNILTKWDNSVQWPGSIKSKLYSLINFTEVNSDL